MDFKSIDTEIDRQLRLLNKEVESIVLEDICEFSISEANDKIPFNNMNYKGIYLFEIKNDCRFTDFDSWVANFIDQWEQKKYRYNFTSNIRKVRIAKHKELPDWIPLYIGKSRNVGKRVYEHIHKELEKRTYALKLKARTNLKDHTFRLKTIEIEVHNYDSILPKIEWQLRNRINPILGKQ